MNQSTRIWKTEQFPFSAKHDDYFFPETRAVEAANTIFLDGNNFDQRLATQRNLTIGELGFGSGLNFFCAVERFLRMPGPCSKLNFLSFELDPFSAEDYSRALAPFPTIQPLLKAAIPSLDRIGPGWNQLFLYEGRVSLTLVVGDVNQTIPEVSGSVDCWFLDGFAPSRNPEMWNEQVVTELARLSRPEASIATWSSAGAVRRNLEAVGFECKKVPGFDGKRERLIGSFEGTASKSAPQSMAIVGGGLAGASLALAAARAGIETTLVDQAARPAACASGNLSGLVYPYFTKGSSLASDVYLSAYRYFLSLFDNFDELSDCCEQVGALQALDSERLRDLFDALPSLALHSSIASSASAEELAQSEFAPDKALMYQLATVVRPEAFVRTMLRRAEGLTNLRLGFQVTAVREIEDGVSLSSEQGEEIRVDHTVLASAWATKFLADFDWLPIEPVRGQIAHVARTSSKLPFALCGSHYALPNSDDSCTVGSLYDHFQLEPEIQVDTLKLSASFPTLAGSTVQSTRTSLRTTSADRLPIIGALGRIDGGEYKKSRDISCVLALGSRGITSAPFLGEAMVASLASFPGPLKKSHQVELGATRFIDRARRKGIFPSIYNSRSEAAVENFASKRGMSTTLTQTDE